ncbi:MAG: glycosyltransferase [Chitinophagaceae bacterium]|nr:glycosyltransferase [Chitinophagaceae bacterium]
MKKIRILYTIPNFDTAGSGKALLNIARRLNPERYEPHIMCMHNKGALFQVVEQSGIPVHLLNYTTPTKPYIQGLKTCWQISRELKKINADIIHSFHYAPDYSEGLAARLAGSKWVYTKKNMNWGGVSKNGWKLRTALANGIVAQNTDMLREFFPGMKKVHLISRGVDTQVFQPQTPKPEILQPYGITPNDRLIICVANLVPVKGVEILFKAFSAIHQQLPEWKVLIVGDHSGDYGAKLMQQTRELNLESKIIFTGKVMNVADYLNNAELFVLTTLNEGRIEGSPVALLEHMRTGRMVLGSAVPGINDQLAAFPNLLFEAGNHQQLAEKLLAICQLPQAEQQALRTQIRNYILSDFPIEKEVIKHMAFYEAVMQGF